MLPNPHACWQALAARDTRWDGVFFVAVTTTRIYCRPICPVRTPRPERCRFFRLAAEAEAEGFRACLRCRPELAPGRAVVDAVPELVRRAVRRIEAGFLNERSIDDLAAVLGVSDRHLRRAFESVLGVSPLELAHSRRLGLARRLVLDGALPLTDVAFASGFRSVRRFNAAFREHFGRPPSALRRTRAGSDGRIHLRLDYRPPLAWDALLSFLADRSIPGVERIEGDTWRRIVRLGDVFGDVVVSPGGPRSLAASASLSLAPVLMPVVANLRAAFDLDADPERVDADLARDPHLRPLVRRRPGLRVPGAFDPFEAAVRALLGQQISVRAATTLAHRLVHRFGTPLPTPIEDGLTHAFPTADVLARGSTDEIASLGMPGARADALLGLARAVASGELVLERGADLDTSVARLRTLRGFGPWTAQYVSMRALSAPDAFPGGDLGVRKALGGITESEATARAERWRPWRAYAVLHLWSSLAEA